MYFRGQGQSIKSEKYNDLKMGISTFNGWVELWSKPIKYLVDRLNHAHWLRISSHPQGWAHPIAPLYHKYSGVCINSQLFNYLKSSLPSVISNNLNLVPLRKGHFPLSSESGRGYLLKIADGMSSADDKTQTFSKIFIAILKFSMKNVSKMSTNKPSIGAVVLEIAP